MRTLVPTISIGVLAGGLLCLAPHHTPFPSHTPTTTAVMSRTRETSTPGLSTRALRGAPVTTLDGTRLGFVDDLVIDFPAGYITLVVVADHGWFGLGGRFVVLPWHLVRPTVHGTALTVAFAPAPPQQPPPEEAVEEPSPR